MSSIIEWKQWSDYDWRVVQMCKVEIFCTEDTESSQANQDAKHSPMLKTCAEKNPLNSATGELQ